MYAEKMKVKIPGFEEVLIKIVHPDAVVPKYATPGSAGFDLVAIEDTIIYPVQTQVIRTGLAMAVPKGFELQIRPRSGLSLHTKLRVANSPGTVDSDYRGEIGIIITNTEPELSLSGYGAVAIKKGDRIAQGVICPVVRAEFEVVDSLDETTRGSGGFGSTGAQ